MGAALGPRPACVQPEASFPMKARERRDFALPPYQAGTRTSILPREGFGIVIFWLAIRHGGEYAAMKLNLIARPLQNRLFTVSRDGATRARDAVWKAPEEFRLQESNCMMPFWLLNSHGYLACLKKYVHYINL